VLAVVVAAAVALLLSVAAVAAADVLFMMDWSMFPALYPLLLSRWEPAEPEEE